jgi:hypothetical protein
MESDGRYKKIVHHDAPRPASLPAGESEVGLLLHGISIIIDETINVIGLPKIVLCAFNGKATIAAQTEQQCTQIS